MTVAVDVGKRAAATDHGPEKIRPRITLCDRHEAGLARAVPEELCGLFISLARLDQADVRLQVAITRQQIEPAIQVVIEKERAELEQRATGAGNAFGHGR